MNPRCKRSRRRSKEAKVIGPWRILLVAMACALVSDGIAGQKPPPLQNAAASRRPRLSSAADTNDWTAYFDYGVAQLRSDPRRAERAFYWAPRARAGRTALRAVGRVLDAVPRMVRRVRQGAAPRARVTQRTAGRFVVSAGVVAEPAHAPNAARPPI